MVKMVNLKLMCFLAKLKRGKGVGKHWSVVSLGFAPSHPHSL